MSGQPEDAPELEPGAELLVDPADPPAADPPPADPAPLLELREGLPDVIETRPRLQDAAAALAAAEGPVAIDAERASGYRYSQRAYLVQLRREGAGTALIDPIAFPDVEPLTRALAGTEWILHAASQDLPCLLELGLQPERLFDTELAGRLLGYPRVGLATMVEQLLGRRMRKEHSAVDWSTRPLPRPWLEYAALDVEVLVELREVLHQQLVKSGKREWAEQEFEHLRTAPSAGPRPEPWRRTSGLHRVRGRRGLAAVRELWEARDALAAHRDVTPSRLLPDSALVEAALALPRDRRALLGLKGFHGRGAQRYAGTWIGAVTTACELPEDQLPPTAARYDGPPPPRAWVERDPAAAARLSQARAALTALSAELDIPTENLISPDAVRRVLWEPPVDEAKPTDGPARGAASAAAAVPAALRELGVRPWQIEATGGLLAQAIDEHPAPGVPPASAS